MPFAYHLALVNAVASSLLALAALCQPRRARGEGGPAVSRWTFAAGMLLLAARSACDAWAESTLVPEEMLRAQVWAHLALAGLPATWLIFSLTHARGNAGEFLRRWRWTVAAAAVLPAALAIAGRADLVVLVSRSDFGEPPTIEYGITGILLHGMLLVSVVVIAMNLERTYRAAVGTLRWRLKFMLLGLAIITAAQFYASSQAIILHGATRGTQVIQAVALALGILCIVRSFLRPGQFAIDLRPSHSALYGSITLVLAGAYLVSVGLLARFAAFLGGDSTFPIRALVVFLGLVGMVLVLQSDRVRMGLRRFVSRHFERPLFDPGTIWQQFSAGMAAATDQPTLARTAVDLVARSLDLHSVSFWLADDGRDSLALIASTAPSAPGTNREIRPAAALIATLEADPLPIDVDEATTPAARILRDATPRQFESGGHRVCIPLVARGTLAGLITLGDRVGGAPFTAQDIDLFRCIGDHVAAALLNLRLSQRVAQAREFEAFQTMATFFVHDLKNAANTLSLLLQNLPEHFDDPVFRADAITSCARTVAHINGLVDKLGTLRSGLAITPAAADLADTVRAALADWPGNCGVRLESALQALPGVHHDREQMRTVFTNLIVNAREATPEGGSVRVTAGLRDGWGVVTVADTGCGMSEEFIRRSLFRPFQTTKKRGLGIGMFQSRMIVEAHGGRITVTSAPDAGSSFEVALPCLPKAQEPIQS